MPDHSKTQRLFGAALRKMRVESEWTQDELAHLCGLNRVFMGEIERGEKSVSIDTIVKIAKAFKITGSALLGRAGI